ncbi:MAG: DUF1254 domain-containing protein [Desulfatitalea sp.]|nr:DUF1254 domain-containing protein [Desulfatitalea sp.]
MMVVLMAANVGWAKAPPELAYDNLDFLRGVETFLNGIPTTSIEGLRLGLASIGAKHSNQVVVFDKLMAIKPLFLTGNTSSVYAVPFLDLKKDGPTVVETPAEAGPGTVNDAYFRFVIDTGAPGPNKGKGRKYLILRSDYKCDIPEGYFTGMSTSYVNWVALRGFLVDGKPDAAVKMWEEGLKIYPFAKAANPPAKKFWSMCVCDPPTRSVLQTDQIYPSKQSQSDKLIVNDDGSIDLYYGPKALAVKEANWIQKPYPGKGLVCCFTSLQPHRGLV